MVYLLPPVPIPSPQQQNMAKIEIRSYRSLAEPSPIACREKSRSWMIISVSCLFRHQLPLTPHWWWPYHSPCGPLFASHSAASHCLNMPHHPPSQPLPLLCPRHGTFSPTCHLIFTILLLLFVQAFPVCLLENGPSVCSILLACLNMFIALNHHLKVDLCVFYLLLCLQCLPSILHLLNGWTNK